MSAQLDQGVHIDEIDLKLRLAVLKPLHVKWVTNFYNHATSEASKKVIESEWQSLVIRDTIRLALSGLPTIDHFHDIALIIEINNSEPDFG